MHIANLANATKLYTWKWLKWKVHKISYHIHIHEKHLNIEIFLQIPKLKTSSVMLFQNVNNFSIDEAKTV